MPTVYSLTNLGTFPGGSISGAAAINNGGRVTGQSNGNGNGSSHAFLYVGGPLQDLGTLTTVPNQSSGGRAINDLGQVAGSATALTDGQSLFNHAFLYGNGTMQDLGTLPGQTRSVATGLSDTGLVVGYSYSHGSFQETLTRAFAYFNGTMTDIGTLGGSNAFAMAVNDAGQIVGYSRTSSSYAHAFVYENGVMTDLGTLAEPPGSPQPGPLMGTYSYGYAINAFGVVAGSSQLNTTSNINHAVLFDNNTVTDLGTLGGTFSAAYGLNAQGTVVGYANTLPAPGSTVERQHAFVYNSGVMEDLNDLLDASGSGWILSTATEINDQGQIVGQGFDPNGQLRAYLLTPEAPVPAAAPFVQINDGSAQRSRVDSMTLTFNTAVSLPANPADAFELRRNTDNSIIGLVAEVTNGATTAVTLRFSGASTESGSLADGSYKLTVWASQVDSGNFDGNNDGIAGDNYVLVGSPSNGLFRLFGDADGNGTVNATDFAAFRGFFGLSGPSIFDFNNDGFTNATDFAQFRSRFGITLMP